MHTSPGPHVAPMLTILGAHVIIAWQVPPAKAVMPTLTQTQTQTLTLALTLRRHRPRQRWQP